MDILGPMHIKKCTGELCDALEKANLAHRSGEWLYFMGRPMLAMYMSCLARAVAAGMDTPIICDDSRLRPFGEFLTLGQANKSEDLQAGDAVVARIDVTFPTNESFENVAMEEILAFRERYRTERGNFRKLTMRTARKAAAIKDPNQMSSFLCWLGTEIGQQRQDYLDLIQKHKAFNIATTGAMFGGLCVAVPTLLNHLALSAFGQPIPYQVIPVAGGILLALSAFLFRSQVNDQNILQKCPWAYIDMAAKRFGP